MSKDLLKHSIKKLASLTDKELNDILELKITFKDGTVITTNTEEQ
jgi:hypothetical protein